MVGDYFIVSLRCLILLTVGCILVLGNVNASTNLYIEKFFRVNTPEKAVQAEEWVGLSVHEGNKNTKFKTTKNLDLDLRLYFKGEESYNFSLQEAYIKNNSRNSSLAFGRMIVDWNPYESYWSLGQLNGNQQFKLLSKKQEGLLGVHYEYRPNQNFKVNLFGSYFHLPSLNPQITIENGKAKSNSEWMRKPPTHALLLDQKKDIFYKMNKPKLNEIIFNRSIGLNLSYKTDLMLTNMYAVYKPESKLRVNAEGHYDSKLDHVVVTTNPIVNHHVVTGANIKTLFKQTEFAAGIQFSDPNAKLQKNIDQVDPVKWESNQRYFYSDYFKIEPSYEREGYFNVNIKHSKEHYLLEFNFIELITNNKRKEGDVYSDSAKWRRTVGVNFLYNLTDRVNLIGDYKFDLVRLDQIISFESQFHLMGNFSLSVGAELIKAPTDNSYWSTYRTNDSFYSAATYYF